MTTMRDLYWLISPLERGAFFDQHWDRSPFHISRNCPHYYGDLFSLQDADTLLGLHRFREGDVRYSPNDPSENPIPLQVSPEGYLDNSEAYRRYQEGSSLLFEQAERYWMPVANLCRNLTPAFGMPVKATAFLSPAKVHSSFAHYDRTANFLLQIEGCKRYRVYAKPASFHVPSREKPCSVSPEQLSTVLLEVELRPGDLLFMPSGFVHEGWSAAGGSLHITLGVVCYTWTELLSEALQALNLNEPALRRTLPSGLLTNEGISNDGREEFAAMLRLVSQSAKLDDAVARLTQRLIESLRPLPANHFEQLDDSEINLSSILQKRPGTVCHVMSDADSATISFPGSVIRGPRSIELALRFVVRNERFRLSDLPGLTDSARLTLVRRLVHEGLLHITRSKDA